MNEHSMSEQPLNKHWNGVDPFEEPLKTPRKSIVIAQVEPNPNAKILDLNVSVLQDMDPRYYDNARGRDNSLVKSTFVKTEIEGTQVVTNLVEHKLWPDRNEPKECWGLEPVTIIVIGGGTSTAMANLGQFSYIDNAQQALFQEHSALVQNKDIPDDQKNQKLLKWRIDNLIAVSNPTGSPRSDKYIDDDTLETSAKHVYLALKKAIRDGSITVNSRLAIMGASAGGNLAEELVALSEKDTSKDRLNPNQLLLSEPAGNSERPQIMKDIIFSGVRSVLKGAREQKLGVWDTLKAVKDDFLVSMTQPHGAPQSVGEMVGLHKTGVKDEHGKLHNPAKEHIDIGKTFGIPNAVNGEAINTLPLKTDSTKRIRDLIKIPVIMELGFRSRAVNPFEGHELLTPEEVATLDINDPKIKEKTEQLKKLLFKNSPQVEVDLDDSGDHSRLGRKPKTWERFLGAAMRIPMPDKV